jgi:hypothetical protein
MRRPLFAAISVIILASSSATAQSAHSEREEAARALVTSEMIRPTEQAVEVMRGMFRGDQFSAAEQAALARVFEAEASALVEEIQERMIDVIVRHVPIEQMRVDANFDSPEWNAAKDELFALADKAALGMTSRVAEVGCAVEAVSSAGCMSLLKWAQETRNGAEILH